MTTTTPEAPAPALPTKLRAVQVVGEVELNRHVQHIVSFGSAQDSLYRTENTTREALTAARALHGALTRAGMPTDKPERDIDARIATLEKRLAAIETARTALREAN